MKKRGILAVVLKLYGAAVAGTIILLNVTKPKSEPTGYQNDHKPYGPYERYLKRPLDCLAAASALVAAAPVLGITALLVRIKLGSPVLFTQERPGKDEQVFKLYKFRTMTDARDERGELLPDSKRMTLFGNALRATSLDELPELINIIRGDMSLIGPRPLLCRYLPYYTKEERHRHDVRPGLSGLAQTHGRNYVKWDKRLEYDIEYVKHISFLGDVKIVLDTIRKVLRREDVASNTDEVETYLDIERGSDSMEIQR